MVKAESVGKGIGGFFNNPSVLVIALGLGALFIFRDKISEFFQSGIDSLGEGLVDIDLPDIKLPDINFPDINFPEFNFPDITNIFGSDDSSILAGETIIQDDESTIFIPEDTTVNPDGTVTSETSPLLDLSDSAESDALKALQEGRTKSELENTLAETFDDPFFGDAEIVSAINDVEFRARETEPIIQSGFTVEADSIFGGGGESFIGGTTTFGDSNNLVDSLSEVLAIFPTLSASQARDALNEFSGLTANEFAQIDPDVINITGG